jgi:hypothetical protein
MARRRSDCGGFAEVADGRLGRQGAQSKRALGLKVSERSRSMQLSADGQYSSARMIVMTRVVTAGSEGSGEPNSVLRS